MGAAAVIVVLALIKVNIILSVLTAALMIASKRGKEMHSKS